MWYDIIRWTLLGLLFVALFGTWIYSRRFAAGQNPLGNVLGTTVNTSLKVLQKRWIDQRTGVALIEAENQTFLLAYTVGGGVSWQPVEKAPGGTKVTSAPLAEQIISAASKR
jgi:flagellar biogenesis protein FliO